MKTIILKNALTVLSVMILLLTAALFPDRSMGASATPADYGYPTPSPDPTLPSGMDTFTPPLLGVASGPAIAEWTRSGSPGDTITVAGPDFSDSTQFAFYGQTTADNAVMYDRGVNTADQTATCVVLPTQLPAWSTYLMWPMNGTTYGMPVAVNQTDAWWIGSNQAVAGDTVSVYGRNLAFDNGTATSWIYIQQAGQAGQWVTPTAVNPYKVSFTLPSLSAGSYEVWTNNGDAGDFGWSGPLTLTVLAASPFAGQSSNVFNVQSYGATGNGTTDDGPDIENALAAAEAAAPAEVYFPAGTYLTNEPLYVRTGVSWLGAGAGNTIIEAGPTFNSNGANTPLISNRPPYGGTGDYQISGLTISWNNNPYIVDYAHNFLELGYENNVTITNCDLNWKGVIGGLDIGQDNYLNVSNCKITGEGLETLGCSYVTIDDNTFYWTDEDGGDLGAGGASYYDVSGNVGQDYDDAAGIGSDIGAGRLVAFSGNNGDNSNDYIGDNETINAGPPSSGIIPSNGGEQVLYEMGAPQVTMNPTSATATTAMFSSAVPTGQTYDAMIISGLGAGEARYITVTSGDTITVSPAWTIIPNSTSVIAIGQSQSRSVAYDNSLNGKSDYATYDTAVVGNEWYGDCWDDIFADNALTDIRNGTISEYTQAPDDSTYTPSAEFFNLATENTLNGAYNGSNITTNVLFQDTPGTLGHLGNTYRWNTLENIVNAGLIFTGATENAEYTGGNEDFDGFEHNTFTNLPIGIQVTPYNTLFSNIYLYDNTFDLGTAAYSGSMALDVTGTTTTFWRADDTWEGFQSTTTDPNTVPPAVGVPVIASFSPTSGAAGTAVTIAGTNFTGATAVKFNGTAATYTVDSATSITAKAPAGVTTGPISVTTPNGTATSSAVFSELLSISSLSLSSAKVTGGTPVTATLALTGPAPAGGFVVKIKSLETPTATVPSATITVAAGNSSAMFTIDTSAVSAATKVTIWAGANGVTKTRTLTVEPPAVQSLTLKPTSVVGGKVSAGTVTLAAVNSVDTTVTLSSSTSAAAVPISVSVPAGQTTATFTIDTIPVSANTVAAIEAAGGGESKTAKLTVKAPAVAALSLKPATLVGGKISTGTVTLSGAAAAPVTVILSSNNAAAGAPASLTIPVGQTSATFTIDTAAVAEQTVAAITATAGGASRTINLTIKP